MHTSSTWLEMKILMQTMINVVRQQIRTAKEEYYISRTGCTSIYCYLNSIYFFTGNGDDFSFQKRDRPSGNRRVSLHAFVP